MLAHYAISDLAGNFGGHGIEFLLSVFTVLTGCHSFLPTVAEYWHSFFVAVK